MLLRLVRVELSSGRGAGQEEVRLTAPIVRAMIGILSI